MSLNPGVTQHLPRNTSKVLLQSCCICMQQMNEWHFLLSSLGLLQRHLRGVFLKHLILTSFIVSLPAFGTLYLNSDPDCSPSASFVPMLSRSNCVSLILFFFVGSLLMQFPVILLALSCKLNWLRWSCLGPMPGPLAIPKSA